MKMLTFMLGNAIFYAVTGHVSTTPKTTTSYYYISGTDNQRLTPGFTNEISPCENSIVSGLFCDVGNWTTTPQSATVSSDYSKYIGYITFNEEATADGGSDGQLTLKEALNAVFTQYSEPGTDIMLSSYIVDDNAQVKVTAFSTCH